LEVELPNEIVLACFDLMQRLSAAPGQKLDLDPANAHVQELTRDLAVAVCLGQIAATSRELVWWRR